MDRVNFFSEDAKSHFTEEVLLFLREQIQIYQGKGILFGGRLHPQGFPKIEECDFLSQGNFEQVSLTSKVKSYNVIIYHPSSCLNPSSENLKIASNFADKMGFIIIDSQVEKIDVVVPIPQLSRDNSVNLEAVIKSFSTGGSLSQALSEFEPRDSQISMVKEVTLAFNQESILLCEAETGTGKSLGYGVVAAQWSMLNKKKVVISTNTINLQEQLLNKDLPVIKECLKKELGQALEIILVKGKNNYLCQRKFEEFKKETIDTLNLSLEDKATLRYRDEILSWGETTLTGDKNELTFIPDYDLWDQLGCENDTCQRSQCRYENRCFQSKLKRDIAKADILIVNHHILCSDLAIKKEVGVNSAGLLPPFERLIVDESHHLEDIATIYFGSQASTFEIKRTLGLIVRIDFKKKILKGGLLSRILRELSPRTLDEINDVDRNKDHIKEEDLRKIFYQQLNAFIEARIHYESFSINAFERIFSYFDEKESFFNFEEEPTRKEYKHRFSMEEMDHSRWHELYRQPLEQIIKHLQGFIDMITYIYNLFVKNLNPEDLPPNYVAELKAYRDRLQNSVNNFQASMKSPDKDEVRWIKLVRNKKQIYFAAHSSPLEVGSLLREHLFDPLKTVILTSATLAEGGEEPFQHIKEQVGLDSLENHNLTEIRLSNDFDYAQNCCMVVPFIPPVNHREFLSALEEGLCHLLEIFRGRMLWLFTSYTMMKQVYRQLEPLASTMGVELWTQGDEPRHELIRKIKKNRNGVLLGVSSFWEGVDIKGENLSCLVMIKLPFAVPDEPVLKARLERLEELGKNPFIDYTLPQAILRFKQGFGRLIRSSHDRGVFVLFDNRIFTKSYGRHFIEALPVDLEPKSLTLKQADQMVKEFLNQ